jgi:RND family efflux transporter MFP subunit
MKSSKMKYTVMLLVVTLLIGGCQAGGDEQAEAEAIYVPVEVMTPREGNISKTLTFTAEIKSEEAVLITPMIMSTEEGAEVLVKVGEKVEKDQVLAVLSGENTSEQVENVRLAYELAKSSYNAQVESYQSAVDNFENIKVLYEAGAVSKLEYDNAKIRASSNQLSLLRDQLNQAKFAYENASESLEDLNITAPVSGIVSDINISENNMVSQQNTITVLSLENLEVTFYVPEGQVGTVVPEMGALVEVPSIDKRITSVVDWVNPQKDPMKNMYKGNVKIDNLSEDIYPGMKAFVHVSLTNDKTYLLPIDAVLNGEQAYVYVADGEKAIIKNIIVGDDDGEMIEILSGLEGDEQVIVKGQNFVKEESVIKVVRGQ